MDNLRFVLLVMFAYLSFLVYDQWQKDYGPKPPVAAVAAVDGSAPAAAAAGGVAAGSASDSAPKPAPGLAHGQRIQIITDVLRIEIDTSGGDIRAMELLKYPVDKDQPDVPVKLLSDDAASLFIAQTGLVGKEGLAPNHHTEWTSAAKEYRLTEGQEEVRVPLTWSNGQGVTVTKTFLLKRGSYLIALEHKVDNQSGAAWRGQQYTQLQRKEPEKNIGSMFSTSAADRAFIGGVLYTPDEKYQKIKFDTMKETNLDRRSKEAWVAMIQHYFLAAWIPPTTEDDQFYTKSLGDKVYTIGAMSPAADVAAGASASFSAQLYAGPKLQRLLESTATGLELTVDYGNLTVIAKPIFWLMEKFYSWFGNWGFAIILGTIVIKGLFYRLSESSYRSMANMRKLQPKLKELKEKYGEDKQQFNMAMMDLYRREKVNPLGGCLPILVQIPVFISLYWVLIESVEMRQAPFLFWLNDLSSMDPYFVLPVIMGISMYIQQKLNPSPVDPIQAKIIQWFPVMFTFMFAFFPSGLVLYWVVNNSLSIVQQWVITKRIEAKA